MNVWHYTNENGDSYTDADFKRIAKGNLGYARDLFDRVTWQSVETLVDEDLRDGELIELDNKYYRTGGDADCMVTDSQSFYNDSLILFENGRMVEVPKIGGYWKNGDDWLAFDNRGGELTIEQFDVLVQAINYAQGRLAITIGGNII